MNKGMENGEKKREMKEGRKKGGWEWEAKEDDDTLRFSKKDKIKAQSRWETNVERNDRNRETNEEKKGEEGVDKT